MTNKKHENNANKDGGKVDFIVRGAVLSLLGMGVPVKTKYLA